MENGVVNVHGHLHGSKLDLGNYINANIHMTDYKLISERQVEALLSYLDKPNTKFLQEWYTGHQIFSEKEMKKRPEVVFEKGIAVRFLNNDNN